GGSLAADDCGGLDHGLCSFGAMDAGAGDQAFCTNACNAHDDCQNPGFWCFGVSYAKNGFCFGATACPNGPSDCTKLPSTVCKPTKYGPKCLDPQWSLGTAAP